MEAENAQPKKTILNYGVLFGLISTAIGVIMYVTNAYLDPHWVYSLVNFFVFVIMVTWGIKAFKADNGGFLALGEALKVGVGIALIGGIITALWSLLLMTVIEPDYMEQMASVQQKQMVERFPDMSQEQRDQATAMGSQYQSPWVVIPISLVVNLLLALVIALFAGLVMKQKRPYEE